MSFFDTTRPEKSSNFRKTEHIDLSPGQTTIRIIDTPEEAYKFHTHYIKGVYIKCLGEDCPVCKSNMKIFAENPDKYRDVPGWSPKAERFAVNVFDKTPVKICKNCKAEIKKNGASFLPVCPKCNQPVIAEPEAPLNKIKVLAKGVTVADLLNGIDASILDKEGNKVGINNFDIVLYVTGTGKQQTISPIPLIDKTEPVEYKPEDKFDLKKIAIELTSEEISDLQRGISLRDIFAARKSAVPADGVEEPVEASEAVKKEIADLLK
jgi:predicted RNA-binding Zn-ribbon protein involved in translation (DUF1610 family)